MHIPKLASKIWGAVLGGRPTKIPWIPPTKV